MSLARALMTSEMFAHDALAPGRIPNPETNERRTRWGFVGLSPRTRCATLWYSRWSPLRSTTVGEHPHHLWFCSKPHPISSHPPPRPVSRVGKILKEGVTRKHVDTASRFALRSSCACLAFLSYGTPGWGVQYAIVVSSE